EPRHAGEHLLQTASVQESDDRSIPCPPERASPERPECSRICNTSALLRGSRIQEDSPSLGGDGDEEALTLARPRRHPGGMAGRSPCPGGAIGAGLGTEAVHPGEPHACETDLL